MNVRWPSLVAVLVMFASACDQAAPDAKPKAATETPVAEASAAPENEATVKDGDADPAASPADASADATGEPKEAAETANAGKRLLEALGDHPAGPVQPLVFELDESLLAGDEASNRIAAELLGVTHQAVADEQVADYIDAVAKEAALPAAKLLVWVVRAQDVVKTYGKRPYAVGRLIVADGKYPTTEVLAQVPITAEGYFATEIGDRSKPLTFRAPGYESLDVPLGGNQGDEKMGAEEDDASQVDADAIVLDDVTLKPLAPEGRSSLRGKIALDDATKDGTAEVKLSVLVAGVNTPSNGYCPRRSWPDEITAKVAANGEFEVNDLTPIEYYVTVTADEHTAFHKRVAFEPGKPQDISEVRLRSSNLGFYFDQETPKTPELAWESDFATALERAKKENRPLMVMMTATWCGPCKMLEHESLGDPWIRHFLEPFVVVQAFEVKEVEEKYGVEGYPTLVFCDSAGESKFKTVGYEPPMEFAAKVARGIKAVELELPAKLQKLVDEKVVVID